MLNCRSFRLLPSILVASLPSIDGAQTQVHAALDGIRKSAKIGIVLRAQGAESLVLLSLGGGLPRLAIKFTLVLVSLAERCHRHT